MSDKAKSILAAGWIAGAAGAFILGSAVRDRIDLATPTQGAKLDNLLASRDNSVAGRMQTDIPAGDFFYELTEKLKKEYYEPISDEQKLASGAVRGMVGYLGDPESTYMDAKQFQNFLNERQGKFEGIGADLEVVLVGAGDRPARHVATKTTTVGLSSLQRAVLQPSPTQDVEDARDQALASDGEAKKASVFPRLTVVSIVPGGPADRAGVQVGDVVYSVDDHWIINPDLSVRFSRAENDFKNHKISWADLNAVRKEVRDKYERMMLPLRAKDQLVTGTAGTVKVVWDRGAVRRTTSIPRASSSMPGFKVSGQTIELPFAEGSAELLKKAVAGKSAVTIDLRNNSLGDFDAMRQCIAAVAPAGTYGYLVNDRNSKPVPLKVSQGNSSPPKLTLLTDRSTRGAAEIFALALTSKGLAKMSGSDTAGAREVYEICQLRDGSGYTLVTSRYRPTLPIKAGSVASIGGHKK